jgi:hypothetical protein
VGRLHAEAIVIERNGILVQSVESGSGCRFAGRKVEACMMPRAPDGGACDHAFVKRTTEVRAICIVSLKPISFSPDEDAGFADNASEDSTVGRGLDFDPLGQIEAVILIVAHPVPRVAGNTHLTCGVPLAQKDDRFVQVKIWTGAQRQGTGAYPGQT